MRVGLTQQELAGRAGISVRALRDLEHGRVRHPRSRSVGRLATALRLADVDYASLLATAGVAAPAVAAGRLRIDVLGPLSVRRGDAVVEVRQAKLRGLLGLLGLQPGQMVSRQELVDALWGEQPPDTCLELLHTYVARLRDLLEPGRPRRTSGRVVVLGAGGYRLDVDADELDVLVFDDLEARARAAGRAGDLDAAQALFGEAVQLWRGPVLADLGPRLRQHPAAVRLAQRRLSVAVAHADLAIERGRWQAAAGPLAGLCAEEPFDEGLHARLMLALAGAGRQAEALRLFSDLRARLADELGVEPGDEVAQAQLRILRGQLPRPISVSGDGDLGGAGPTATTSAANGMAVIAQLPPDVAGFIGRSVELDCLDRLGQRDTDPTAVPITVVTGMAGVGKTALAVHWAHRVYDRFPDGQLYVNLRGYAPTVPIRPVEALAGFLHALGVPAEQVPVDVEQAAGLYRSLLAGKRLLVLLDNARTPDQVRPLLPASSGCRVLITSRDRLSGLVAHDGARRLTLDTLEPAQAYGLLAWTLGEERAAGEPEATAELAQLCAFLPLALRIAAANLTDRPQTIASYTAELGGGNRLGALEVEGDARAAVRAAFDLSYSSLSVPTRRLFRLLGLVPGPDVTIEAAAVLIAASSEETAHLLRLLTDAHLLEQHAPGRFTFHDLLRLYAAQRADDEESQEERRAARIRLVEWYLDTADAAARLLYPERLRLPRPEASPQPAANGLDLAQALSWLDAERPNLVAAIQYAAEHGPRSAAWLLADTLHGYFWSHVHTSDWLAVADASLAAARAAGDLRAQAATRLSLADAYWRRLGHYRQAIDHFLQALSLTRQTDWLEGQAAALGHLGGVYWDLGRLQEAEKYHTQALAIDRRTNQLAGQAIDLANLGLVYQELGRLQEAANHLSQALALDRALELRNGISIDMTNLGGTLRALGQFDQALNFLTHALELQRELGDKDSEPATLYGLAEVHRDTGRHAHALELAHAALYLARDNGNRLFEADALNVLATIHERLGQHRQTVDYHRQAIRLARANETHYPEIVALVGLTAAHQHLGETDEALAVASQALILARQTGYRVLEGQVLTALAVLHRSRQCEKAIKYARQALEIHRDTGHRLGEAQTLLTLGQVLNDTGQTDSALANWRMALAIFTAIGTPEVEDVRNLLALHGSE
jgi:DNA-binding SARP family transcriptional activator/Tfp pilus assembly protein PilF